MRVYRLRYETPSPVLYVVGHYETRKLAERDQDVFGGTIIEEVDVDPSTVNIFEADPYIEDDWD